MRAKAARFLSMVLLAVSSLPFVAFAQPPLTQTYTSADGMITMSFPDGWTVSEDDGVINFFDGVSSFMEVGVNDYGDDVTMQEILEIGASVTYGFTEPESIVVGGWPALRAIDTGAFDQHHTLVNFCDGNMALIIGFGNVAVTGPTFEAMTDTLVYGGGEPQLCRGAFEGHAPITASNAASIAPLTTLGDADVTVMAVAFSPDGKLLAAAGDNRSVRLWSVLTGEEEVGLRGQAGDVSSLSFDNGTYQLVLGSGDGRVRLWNLDGGTSLSQYQSHDAPVLSVARQPDGFLVVSGAADGSVRVYDMLRGDEREPLVEAGGSPVTSVAFSPDEMRLAAGGGSMIQVWEAETGLLLSQVETPLTAITGLSFSPDGAQIVFAGDGDVWTWDVA
ncbi:MAG: hypothetical protein JNL34_04765, partial [Anaerolineae bacterium]|nr:hypothetical protein [Anaerolineae bacterium]